VEHSEKLISARGIYAAFSRRAWCIVQTVVGSPNMHAIACFFCIYAGIANAQVSQEEDFVFDAAGDAEAADWLTDNLRLDVDLLTRYETAEERGDDGWLNLIALDIHKVLSDSEGDIGTLLLQPSLARRDGMLVPNHVKEDHRWKYEVHDFYFNYTKYGQGRTNIRMGRFDIPYGLEPNVDTHLRLHQYAPHMNLGAKKDWGVSLNGTLPDFDYEVALTRGSGHEFINKGNNFVVAGRIGTPSDANFVVGLSAMYGEIMDKQRVNRFRKGLPAAAQAGFMPADDIVQRHRFGIDATSVHGQFTLRSEVSVGRDFEQEVVLALGDITWSNPDGKLSTWAQILSWSQNGTTGWDADLQLRIGVDWQLVNQWTLSARVIHDFEKYLNTVNDTIFTTQLRWTF
jgi:hypothetical protein